MKDLLHKADHAIKEIQENSRYLLRELKALKKTFGMGDFSKLGNLIQNNRFENSLNALGLESLYNEINNKYQGHIANLRMDFDKELVSACHDLNLKEIKGNSMNGFQIRGILRLNINFQKNISELKTFIHSKKLKSLDPIIISHELKKEIERLFERPFDPKEFLSILFKAYQQSRSESKKVVLLKDVHKILWMEKQKDGFFETSDHKKLVSYPLDEFSVDIGKLMESNIQALDNDYVCRISLGAGGVNIFKRNGEFNAYKFLEFVKGGENA